MKKLIILTVILLASFSSFGYHKDKHYFGNYGNVKTFVRTGFDYYGSTIRLEILGKLTEKLTKKLAYKDTIIIEFNHDYTKHYPKVSLLENCNANNLYVISNGVDKLKKRRRYLKSIEKNAIAIRILDRDINIENTLKLIEHAILNKITSVKNKGKYQDFYNKKYTHKYSYFGLKKEKVKEISNSNPSEIILNLLKENIQFIDTESINAYFMNGSYTFKNEHFSFSTKNLKYLTKNNNNVYIFPTKDTFVFISDSNKTIKKHQLDFSGSYPFYVGKFNHHTHKSIKNGVYLHYLRSSQAFTFSEEKNEIIEYFKRKE